MSPTLDVPVPEGSTASRQFKTDLVQRHRRGRIWLTVFQASTVIGILVLAALLFNIVNGSMGYVAVETNIDPDSLAIEGVPVQDLTKEQLTVILQENVSSGLFRRFENDMPFEERDP